MKRAWDPATLTVLWWRGDEPDVGDVLQTSTGRRYQVLRKKYGKPSGGKLGPLRAFETVVLPKDAPLLEGNKVFAWEWGKRMKGRPDRRVFLGTAGSKARGRACG